METSLFSMMLQSLLALAAVLGLFALMVWGMKRFQLQGGGGAQDDFKVIRRVHIDNKNSVVEIRHRGSHYLLAISPGGMTQLNPADALKQSECLQEAEDEESGT